MDSNAISSTYFANFCTIFLYIFFSYYLTFDFDKLTDFFDFRDFLIISFFDTKDKHLLRLNLLFFIYSILFFQLLSPFRRTFIRVSLKTQYGLSLIQCVVDAGTFFILYYEYSTEVFPYFLLFYLFFMNSMNEIINSPQFIIS